MMMAMMRRCMGSGSGFAWGVLSWVGTGQSAGVRICFRYSRAGNWTTTWDTPIKLGRRPE